MYIHLFMYMIVYMCVYTPFMYDCMCIYTPFYVNDCVCMCVVCICTHVQANITGQFSGVCSILPPCESQGLNSGLQV